MTYRLLPPTVADHVIEFADAAGCEVSISNLEETLRDATCNVCVGLDCWDLIPGSLWIGKEVGDV